MPHNQALRLRSLLRAAELCGGPEKLAEYLGVTPSKLGFMLNGSATVPEELFLQVVDLLISRNITELTQATRKDASP